MALNNRNYNNKKKERKKWQCWGREVHSQGVSKVGSSLGLWGKGLSQASLQACREMDTFCLFTVSSLSVKISLLYKHQLQWIKVYSNDLTSNLMISVKTLSPHKLTFWSTVVRPSTREFDEVRGAGRGNNSTHKANTEDLQIWDQRLQTHYGHYILFKAFLLENITDIENAYSITNNQ